MKKYCLLIFGLFFSLNSIAQNYGNEWINFNQEYFKIKVLENGFHKVTYQQLSDMGFPVDDVNPQAFQLWYRGEQMAIEVRGEQDGTFNSTDDIVFYGKVADASLETPLYVKPEYQQHTSYSLYSDTSYYYLTWQESVQGKRIQQLENVASSDVLNRVTATQEIVYTDNYAFGEESIDLIYKAEFDNGEGWLSSQFGLNTNKPNDNFKTIVFTGLSGAVKELNTATLQLGLMGLNDRLHRVEIQIGNAVTQTYNVPDFDSYVNQDVSIQLNSQTIVNDSLVVKIACFGGGDFNDFIGVSFARLTYQKQLDKVTQPLESYYVKSAEQKLEVLKENYTSVFNISDNHNITKFKTQIVTTKLVVDLPMSNNEYQLCFWDETIFKSVHSIKKAEGFVNDLLDANYIILTHKLFMDGSLAYEEYRESTQGGEYNVHVVELERVFDQYMYGEKNPLAIRNLFRYLIDNNQKPAHFFIVGSGVKHNVKYNGVPYARKLAFKAKKANGDYYYPIHDYILTFGDPGWDIGFTAGLDGEGELIPAVSTSRLPCFTNQDVYSYLNKVKEFENPLNVGLWRKRFIHISGGQTTSEQTAFLNMVNGYKNVADKPFLGAKITTFSKKSDVAVQFFNMSKEVNSGVGMITYIGHSSPLFLEIDLGMATDEVNGYKNKGKYPLLYFNGCYSGDIFQQYSKAQDWVIAPNKGAIAAFAHNAYGYTNELHGYTLTYYLEAFADSNNFDLPLGLLHKEVIKAYLLNRNKNDVVRSQAQLLSLIGDPAVHVFPYSNPDYSIEKVKVASYDGERVTAVSDTFKLNVVVNNYGIVRNEPFSICVERSFGQSQEVVKYGPYTFDDVYYQDTISLLITSNSLEWAGLNHFKIKIDCTDSLPEENKLNNEYDFSFVMPSNGVKALFPSEFSIVGDTNVLFKAQTYDLTIDSTLFEFQLDTAVAFLNPILDIQKKSKSVFELKDIYLPNSTDSTVYYWRVKLEGDTIWTMSSFTYVGSQSGFGQFELDQFYKNQLDNVFRDTILEKWQFDTSRVFIELSSAGTRAPNYLDQTFLKVNNRPLMLRAGEAICGTNNLFMVAFDKKSALPFHPDGLTKGNCGLDPQIIYNLNRLDREANQLNTIKYFNKLDDGDYLLVFTTGNPRLADIGDSLRTILKSYGATLIDSVVNASPYVFFGRKGKNEVFFESVGKTNTDVIELEYSLEGRIFEGSVWSPVIGPASQWDYFQDSYTLDAQDSVFVEIYGVRFDFTDSLLWSLGSSVGHYLALDIDESEFPYLKAKVNLVDTVDFSSPQLNFWSVGYVGVPEGTLVVNDSGDDLELFEGNLYNHQFLFANISDVNFLDSITIEVQLIGERETLVWYEKIAAVKANDTVAFNIEFSTIGWAGFNQLQIFVNPYIQLEEDYSNNVFEMNFNVIQDFEHPLLDFKVNGIHIKNGDWVQNDPTVDILIFDNNKFRPIKDTTNTLIYFKTCEKCQYSRLYFDDKRLIWHTQGDTLKIQFLPGELIDELYSIRVITADYAGNKTSETPYELSFEIKSEKKIVVEGPFPNPVVEELRFQFAFSGALPTDISIYIYDDKGRLVKVLTSEDYTVFKIGKSGGLLTWDLKDGNNSKLTSGVYIYTIIGTEEFNLEGLSYGKIVITR